MEGKPQSFTLYSFLMHLEKYSKTVDDLRA